LIVPVFVLVLWLSEYALEFLSGVLEGLHSLPHTGPAAALFSGLPEFNSNICLAGGILLLIQAFNWIGGAGPCPALVKCELALEAGDPDEAQVLRLVQELHD
jgi:hypothetical protein